MKFSEQWLRLWVNPDASMQEIADKHSKTVAQIALRYQIQRGVVVIPKSVNKTRIISNIDIFDFELSDEDMIAIKALNQDYRTCDVDGWASRLRMILVKLSSLFKFYCSSVS